jgi:hypothetical protein
MSEWTTKSCVLVSCIASTLFLAPAAFAVGEPVNGFPTWEERVLHQWHNRARSDPQFEMANCPSGNCPDAACYLPVAPLSWSLALNRAARFHSDELFHSGCFQHPSVCTVVSNIDSLYPASCDGSASCACVGGSATCGSCPSCTTTFDRLGLFGVDSGSRGENMALGPGPDTVFYLWLFEAGTSSSCGFTADHGHRWAILEASFGSFGAGVVNATTVNFGPAATVEKIPSAAHYPRQAASVELWANWFDAAGPVEALANVGGTCIPMSLERGTQENGAWEATATAVESGCHRYYFEFQDSSGLQVTYPTTGSLGIGPAGSCADWDSTRPVSCTTVPQLPALVPWGVAILVGGLGSLGFVVKRRSG